MTTKQKFMAFLRRKGFKVSDDFFARFDLVPHHYKTQDGNHVLVSNITITNFDGVNTKDGNLGCVVMYYDGVERRKHCKRSCQSEILKKCFCPKDDIEQAKKTFKLWQKQSQKQIEQWQTVL